MHGVQITVPAELLEAAGVNPLTRLEMPIEAFMVFAGKHEAPMPYSVADLEEDRPTLERLSS